VPAGSAVINPHIRRRKQKKRRKKYQKAKAKKRRKKEEKKKDSKYPQGQNPEKITFRQRRGCTVIVLGVMDLNVAGVADNDTTLAFGPRRIVSPVLENAYSKEDTCLGTEETAEIFHLSISASARPPTTTTNKMIKKYAYKHAHAHV
jgi:hypothetical protein